MSLKKIECLEYLFDKLQCRVELLQFLTDEKLLPIGTMNEILVEHHTAHASRIFSILMDLQRNEKVQLVDFEWTLLPRQHAQLTIITNTAQKVFTYSI